MLSILKLITKITKLIIKKVRAYIDKKIFKDLVLKEFENYNSEIGFEIDAEIDQSAKILYEIIEAKI